MWISTKEAAHLMGMTESGVIFARNRGDVIHRRVGGAVEYDLDSAAGYNPKRSFGGNKYEITGDTAVIKTLSGNEIKVDADDLDWLLNYSWSVNGHGYAVTYTKGGTRQMHKFILWNDEMVDHINHDTLDNRRSNLRPCTHQQNGRNKKRFRGASKFKGVALSHRKKMPWVSSIRHENKRRHLGHFKTELEAALAFDQAAYALDPVYYKLNFPERFTPRSSAEPS